MTPKLLLLVAVVGLFLILCLSIYFRKKESEYFKAMKDAVLFGTGFLKITPDGKHKRIDPEDIFIKEPSK